MMQINTRNTLWLGVLTFIMNPSVAKVLENRIVKPTIHTVQFEGLDEEEPYPVLRMGTDDKLYLKFDEFSGEIADYQYTVVHCDYNWEPSRLMQNQYLDGMFFDYITNNNTSFNTQVRYMHYEAEFPNFNFSPRVPGNYVLKVYENGDENSVVLTRRFFVTQLKAHVQATVRRATLAKFMYTHQEVDFAVDISQLNSFNPRSDFKVLLRQNNRWDNAIFDLEPQFVTDDKLQYNLERGNLFKGYSEFRFFETRNVRFGGQNIFKTYIDSNNVVNAVLYADESREFLAYSSRFDANGTFIIRSDQTQDDAVESDYVWVHFYLKAKSERLNDVYVFGGLSNWQLQPRCKMTYDAKNERYHARLLLKQGYYNYAYVESTPKGPDMEAFEGTHYQTENDYEIFVYQWSMDLQCHLLVGYRRINTMAGEQLGE